MQVGTLTIGGAAVQTATSAFQIAKGTTADRPAAVTGMLRFNTDTQRLEHGSGASPVWANVGLGDGTVTSVNLASDSTGLTVSNGTVTGSGTIRLNLAGELAGLNALDTTGFVARTATGTYAARTLSFSGDATGTTTLAGNTALTLANTGVTAGSYGGLAATLVIAVDAKGRLTSATAFATRIASNAVTDATPFTLANTIVRRDTNGSFSSNVINAASFIGPLAGNSSSATKLETSRTITLSGDTTGSVGFDGSANVTIATTLSNTGVVAGNYGSSNAAILMSVDSKGRVTAIGAQAISIGSNAVFDASPQTSSNTIVKRDASGGFSANDIDARNLTTTNTVRAQTLTGNLNGLTANGIVVRTIANTYTQRSITVSEASGQNGLAVNNGNGVSGDPVISFQPTKFNIANVAVTDYVIAFNASSTFRATVGTLNTVGQVKNFYASQFDNPSTAGDWNFKTLAPAQPDPTYTALTVRAFDDTAIEAVGFMMTPPINSNGGRFNFRVRAATAATSSSNNTVVFSIVARAVPMGGAPSSWSTSGTIASLPLNSTDFYLHTQSITWASGNNASTMIQGIPSQFQIARVGSNAGDTLVGDAYLLELFVEFF